MSDSGSGADRRWLDAMWPFVRDHLPPSPGRVVDIGFGPLGGFVPVLRAEGVDPEAPEGPQYHRVEFERYTADHPAAAVVASTSPHLRSPPAPWASSLPSSAAPNPNPIVDIAARLGTHVRPYATRTTVLHGVGRRQSVMIAVVGCACGAGRAGFRGEPG